MAEPLPKIFRQKVQVCPLERSTRQAYHSMLRRCFDQKYEGYKNYGGRGITVCERWRNGDGWFTGYQCFVQDVSVKPEKHLTFDRIDNNGNYEPGNCRWATWDVQAKNRRRSTGITIDGVTRQVAEWASISGVPGSTIYDRLRRGVRGAALLRRRKKS